MLSIKALLILFLVEMPSVAHGRGISNTYSSSNMDKVCGTVINLNGDSLPGTFFSLTSGQYPKNFNCILTIKAATANQRVIVVTEKMDVACGGDTLLIYDGKKDPGSVLNKNVSSQCGTGKHAYRTATSNTAIIEFVSNADKNVGAGFTINVAINFPVATCSRSDNLYKCRNGNCISNLFNCNERNWCGDNTQLLVCR